MIDTELALVALRNRLLGVTVAATGAVSQTATATGYHRNAGSYLTDNFRPGMEITSVSGFLTAGNNQSTSVQGRVITAVTASDISCTGTAIESAATATIAVGLPFCRAWEGFDVTPVSGSPYVEEAFVPATSELVACPAAGGLLEETGLYILRIYALQNYGSHAIRRVADAIRLLFTPGTAVSAGSYRVRVSEKTASWAGQPLSTGDGWLVCVLTIPWYVETTNAIAA
jgi:hypothetical protein